LNAWRGRVAAFGNTRFSSEVPSTTTLSITRLRQYPPNACVSNFSGMKGDSILTDRRQSDQQRQARAIPNPFEDQASRVNEFTAQEIATLQSRLNKQLGPEYISTRQGAGGIKVPYLAAEKVINLANEVFGFNGWSSEVRNVHIDYVEEKEGKVSMNCSVIMRVTLKDGTYHEDIGCGSMENSRSKAAAFDKAKKEAATDAMKRALRSFGNVLGNCLYDKGYLSKVTKLKVAPCKWDEENLHRHPSYAPVKRQAISDTSSGEKSVPPQRTSSVQSARTDGATEYEEYEGLFSETDFEHPDEVRLDDTTMIEAETEVVEQKPEEPPPQAQQAIPRVQSMPAIRQTNGAGPPVQNQQSSRPSGYQRPPQAPGTTNCGETRSVPPSAGRMMPPPQDSNHGPRPPVAHQHNQPQTRGTSLTPESSAHEGLINPPIGFVTGRAAEALTKTDAPTTHLPRNSAFNPHAQSPSIRRTSGIDHNTSHKVTAVDVQKAKVVGQPNAHPHAGPSNFMNPQADPARRIGVPSGAGQSPLANRGLYRPPGPAVGAVKRPALADVTNVAVGQAQVDGAVDGADAKKVKVGP
jgi:DNA repair and recombination protein RAD52